MIPGGYHVEMSADMESLSCSAIICGAASNLRKYYRSHRTSIAKHVCHVRRGVAGSSVPFRTSVMPGSARGCELTMKRLTKSELTKAPARYLWSAMANTSSIHSKRPPQPLSSNQSSNLSRKVLSLLK